MRSTKGRMSCRQTESGSVLDAAQTEGLVDEFEQPLDVVVNQIDQFVQAFFVLYVG